MTPNNIILNRPETRTMNFGATNSFKNGRERRQLFPRLPRRYYKLRAGFIAVCSMASMFTLIAFARRRSTSHQAELFGSDDTARSFVDIATHPVHNNAEVDIFEFVPVDDENILKAVEELRLSINSQRRLLCPAMRPYDEVGIIQYAKKRVFSNGTSHYRLEVVFGQIPVFAHLAHALTRRQSIESMAELDVSRNETDDLEEKISILLSVPEACENTTLEQLAISKSGKCCMHL
jgi:hypothetical protein